VRFDDGPLGLRLSAKGHGQTDTSAVILLIAEGGAADRCGVVTPGMEVRKVKNAQGEWNTDRMSFSETMDVVTTAARPVEIVFTPPQSEREKIASDSDVTSGSGGSGDYDSRMRFRAVEHHSISELPVLRSLDELIASAEYIARQQTASYVSKLKRWARRRAQVALKDTYPMLAPERELDQESLSSSSLSLSSSSSSSSSASSDVEPDHGEIKASNDLDYRDEESLERNVDTIDGIADGTRDAEYEDQAMSEAIEASKNAQLRLLELEALSDAAKERARHQKMLERHRKPL